MGKFLNSYAFKIRAAFGKFSTAITELDELNSLLQKLYPKCCDKKLIRLGPKGDGGYLVPDDFMGIEACFSPGVSTISGFEKDCADLGMRVFMADKSVNRPSETHNLFHFTKKFIGVTSNDSFMTLENWLTSVLPDSKSDLLLQMDIEGYEYEVLLAASDLLLKRFRIIVVEFHSFQELWNFSFFKIASRVFEKILQTHTCLHIHPNNVGETLKHRGFEIPHGMEFTFLRNDRISNTTYQRVFPHPLDYDCTDRKTLTLPKCWYKGE